MRQDASWPEQRLYRLIFESAPDPTVVVDDDGRALLMNRAARELPGIDLGRLLAWSPARDPELTSFRARLRVGGRAQGEVAVVDDRGRERRLWLAGRAYGPHYVVVVRDVTEQRHDEAEVQQLRRREAVGLLAASIVHDLNNALTAIACTSVLLPRAPEAARASELSHDLARAVQHAAELTRRVHALLRRAPSPPQRVDVPGAVQELRPLLEGIAGSAVAVHLDVDEGAGDVVVERERLDHALLQLAADARDRMPRGGRLTVVVRRVTFGEPREGVVDCAPGAYVSIGVTDTGVEIGPAARERLFETRRDEASRLAGVRAFIADTGGCFTLGSAPEQGTSVVLYLPLAATRANAGSPAESPTRGDSEAVLIVERDDILRRAMRAALLDGGYRVIDAPTAETAARQAEQCPWPVALMIEEAALQGSSARALAERVRGHGHTPKLLLTAGPEEIACAASREPAAPVLRKVFSPADLLHAVRRALEGAGLHDGAAEEGETGS